MTLARVATIRSDGFYLVIAYASDGEEIRRSPSRGRELDRTSKLLSADAAWLDVYETDRWGRRLPA